MRIARKMSHKHQFLNMSPMPTQSQCVCWRWPSGRVRGLPREIGDHTKYNGIVSIFEIQGSQDLLAVQIQFDEQPKDASVDLRPALIMAYLTLPTTSCEFRLGDQVPCVMVKIQTRQIREFVSGRWHAGDDNTRHGLLISIRSV